MSAQSARLICQIKQYSHLRRQILTRYDIILNFNISKYKITQLTYEMTYLTHVLNQISIRINYIGFTSGIPIFPTKWNSHLLRSGPSLEFPRQFPEPLAQPEQGAACSPARRAAASTGSPAMRKHMSIAKAI